MKVAIYARVSTDDKDQNPETQLLPLREFAGAHADWHVAAEYVDHASSTDLRRRTAWRDLLDAAAKRKFDVLLVWRIDRAFRSVLDAATTLERLRTWGVGLRSYQEPWLDTTSPFGEALYYVTAAYAQLERETLRERVKAGMERARREGKRVGRPPASERERFQRLWPEVLVALRDGTLSKKRAAKKLGVGYATLTRHLAEADAASAVREARPP